MSLLSLIRIAGIMSYEQLFHRPCTLVRIIMVLQTLVNTHTQCIHNKFGENSVQCILRYTFLAFLAPTIGYILELCVQFHADWTKT